MKLYDIEGFDEVHQRLEKENIPEALFNAAMKVKEKARSLFVSKLPMATHKNPKYDDTLVDAIYAGHVHDGRIKITSVGNRKKGSGTFRTRFFMGTTKRREAPGYRRTKEGKKFTGMEDRGRIWMKLNSVSYALRSLRGELLNDFEKDLFYSDSDAKNEEKAWKRAAEERERKELESMGMRLIKHRKRRKKS